MNTKTSTLDVPESVARKIDEQTKSKTGMNLFNWLTFASIAASIGFFLTGKKALAIFIGLWPPTFQALKSANQKPKNE